MSLRGGFLIMELNKLLQGKKTYILAIITLVFAVSGYLQGSFDLAQALEIALASGFAGSFRSALTK